MEIRELKIYSSRIDEQKEFYKNVLGFQCKRNSDTKLCLQTKENTLIIEKSEKCFYYHFAFLIPTGTVQNAINFLESRDIELLLLNKKKIIHFKTGKSIYFYDKDENTVEFIERPSLNYPSKETFSINDIIKLNEIGLPTLEPIKTANSLMKQFGIKPININDFSESFCWVGDFNGVIIVVKEGRNWLPTDKPGVVNDFSVHYTEEGKEFRLTFNNNEIKNWH